MSGTTVVSDGGVSVSTAGALTGQLLQQFVSALSVSSAVTVAATSTAGTQGAPVTLPAAPTTSGNNTLVIPSGDSGVISVPGGYQFVIYQGTGSLVGGDANTVVFANNYRGPAGTVLATGSAGGRIVNTVAGGQIGLAAGNELVFGLADSQGYRFDSGFSTLVSTGASEAASVGGTASVLAFFGGASSVMQTGGSATIVANPASSTSVVANSGNTVLWDSNAGDAVTLGSGNAMVLNANGKTTITAGSGADTVFGQGSAPSQGGVIYHGGSGSSFFIGGPGTSTVYAAANETAFGGTGGGLISVAGNTNLLFIGGGGADTISGSGTVPPTIWGNAGENLTVNDGAQGGIYILFGNNEQMDLTNTGGGAHILALDGAPFTGNATLTMSSAGNDSLVLFSPDQFGMAHQNATITVMNWQASDLLDLSFATTGAGIVGYTDQDVANAQAALASGNQFTLSDGTTVVFQGNKPTTIAHI
jgi:hypothetical protein